MRFAIRLAPVAVAGAAIAVLLGLIAASGAGNNADSFAIDLDTTGNSAIALGTREECLEVNAGDNVTFDVTATNIPGATAMIAFAYAFTYDPAAISVTAADADFLLGSTAGSNVFVAGDETGLPDTDGTFVASAADTSVGTEDSGSGVLERVTIAIDILAPAGGYTLALDAAQTAHVDTQSVTHPPDALFGARLAVDVTCASLPPPTPAPTFLQGDVDCNDSVNSVDALKVLRYVAGLSVSQQPGCPLIGTGSPFAQGDVDCNNSVNSVDALKVLRYVAGLSVSQQPGCTLIGE